MLTDSSEARNGFDVTTSTDLSNDFTSDCFPIPTEDFTSKVHQLLSSILPPSSLPVKKVTPLTGGSFHHVICIQINHDPHSQSRKGGASLVGGINEDDDEDNSSEEVILRIPRYSYLRPVDEVAVLEYLTNQTSIPVPRVLHYDFSSNNAIENPYILLSRLPGQCLANVYRDYEAGKCDFGLGRQKELIKEVIRMLKKFYEVRFDTIGMLVADLEGENNSNMMEMEMEFSGFDKNDIEAAFSSGNLNSDSEDYVVAEVKGEREGDEEEDEEIEAILEIKGIKVDQAWDLFEDIFPRSRNDPPRPKASSSDIPSFLEERWKFHILEEERRGFASGKSESAYMSCFREVTRRLFNNLDVEDDSLTSTKEDPDMKSSYSSGTTPQADNTHPPIILFHTDFTPRNIFVDPKTGKITGILDWDRVESAPIEAAWTIPAWLWDHESCGSHQLGWADPDEIPTTTTTTSQSQESKSKSARPHGEELRNYFMEEVEKELPGYVDLVRKNKMLWELLRFARLGLKGCDVIRDAEEFLERMDVPIVRSFH